MLYRWRKRDFRKALLLGVVISLPVAAQQGDAYLQQLDSEARDLSLDRKTEDLSKEVKGLRSAAGLSELPASGSRELSQNLTQEEFEQDLRKNFFGSFLFYQKLDHERKKRIFDLYRINPDHAKLRKAIQRSLKQQRREK